MQPVRGRALDGLIEATFCTLQFDPASGKENDGNHFCLVCVTPPVSQKSPRAFI